MKLTKQQHQKNCYYALRSLISWRWTQQSAPKRWYLCTRHDVTSQRPNCGTVRATPSTKLRFMMQLEEGILEMFINTTRGVLIRIVANLRMGWLRNSGQIPGRARFTVSTAFRPDVGPVNTPIRLVQGTLCSGVRLPLVKLPSAKQKRVELYLHYLIRLNNVVLN